MANEKKYCCKNCNKVLFFGELVEGRISKDCPACGERNVFIAERVTNERFELIRKENPLNGYKQKIRV